MTLTLKPVGGLAKAGAGIYYKANGNETYLACQGFKAN